MPDAERMRLRRQNETPEARSVRLQKQRERQAILRTDLSDLVTAQRRDLDRVSEN